MNAVVQTVWFVFESDFLNCFFFQLNANIRTIGSVKSSEFRSCVFFFSREIGQLSIAIDLNFVQIVFNKLSM